MKRILLAIGLLTLAACGDKADQGTLADAEAATATLDAFYETAANADYEGWIALFDEDARFYGTDGTEDWPYEEFSKDVKEGFEAGRGWDFDVRDRRITISDDGRTAWFAEIAHFNTTDYTLRPTGVMVNEDGQWKISQLVMGVPFPNAIYDPFLSALQVQVTGGQAETNVVAEVLDHLHELAAGGDADAYFALYRDDAMFIGTDVTERWDLETFRAYAEPAFADGEGWVYTVRERKISLSPMGNVAWFDETLDSRDYGTARGTGVLIRERGGEWKIAQYHLTFPIPNDIADDVIELIKAAE